MIARIVSFTDRGERLAERLAHTLGGSSWRCESGGLADWVADGFEEADALVFVGATGIAVRAIADHVRSKASDPAVVVVDERGRHVIPILSGHLGGANELAKQVARICGGEAVITTATDVAGVFAFDEWARSQRCKVINPERIKEASSRLLAGMQVSLWSDVPVVGAIPRGVVAAATREDADVIISARTGGRPEALRIVPRALVLGVGCKKDTPAEALEQRFHDFMAQHRYAEEALVRICSIDAKAHEEGLIALCVKLRVPFEIYTADELAEVPGDFASSAFVETTVGVDNVCERSAVLGSRGGTLAVGKDARDGIALALAMRPVRLAWPVFGSSAGTERRGSGRGAQDLGTWARRDTPRAALSTEHGVTPSPKTKRLASGTLSVVGLGPGGEGGMTADAMAALEAADVLCGYTAYVELIAARFPDKERHATGMGGELERCRWAVEEAARGRTVALVCSGDAGVYGMAGPVLELAADRTDLEIVVVPGVTAALSGAAVLGAPLTNDYACISLSDHLTPWDSIERRLRAVSQAGMALVLYNPASRQRPEHLRRACDVLLETLAPTTVCGWVKNIGRSGQEHALLTLAELRGAELDMFTTVFVGAPETVVVGGRMVTPRGYEVRP